MITPEQVRPLAKKAMEDFINTCNCETREDAANALMTLAGIAGVAMCMLVGKEDTLNRMAGVVEFTQEHGRDEAVPGVQIQ